MNRTAERWLDELSDLITSGPSASGEYRMHCPDHGPDRDPSASANPEKGSWYCGKCERGGKLSTLIRRLKASGPSNNGIGPEDDGPATYDPFEGLSESDFQPEAKARRTELPTERLSEAKVTGWHEALMADGAKLRAFMEERALDLATVKAYQIGWDSSGYRVEVDGEVKRIGRQRYTIPIRDDDGNIVNVRRYRMGTGRGPKMTNSTGHGSPPRLFPTDQLEHDEVMVVEGELDALAAIAHGVPAVSGTGGAGRWDDRWGREFEDKTVYVMYDNDEDGRKGAKRANHNLGKHAEAVHMMAPMVDQDKGDLTDYFVEGGTEDGLREAMDATPHSVTAEKLRPKDPSIGEPVSVRVVGSMDSTTNGNPLEMLVTITGKKNPTYSVPRKALLTCNMDAGPRCKACVMAVDHEGEYETEVLPTDIPAISQFLDVKKPAVVEVLRAHIGARKCDRLHHTSVEQQTIEEIYVMGSVDRKTHEATDYTQRRVYNVGRHDTETNAAARLVGTTIPSPRTQRNEFFAWHMEESVTSLDSFTMTPELEDALCVFQPGNGQGPLDKAKEISQDLSANVTKIVGRERLHMAMDLVWHSVLHFPLDGKIISRGWLELLVVGDTRTGKSETAIRLADHYDLGHIIGCEGATFAGLIGGVKEVGESRVVNWGEVTLNDRRLCVLDEASGLSEELIAQLSDVRSRGVAQITKIETQVTNARCRLVWISNARASRFIDEKRTDGIDVIRTLIGNPEDIARFDFAMSVSMNDVDGKLINSPDRPEVPHIYTKELCRNLILWAWSRRADQVKWDEDAYRQVYQLAEKIGSMYSDSPPLIQRTNVREKIARLAVALAARTFSTDETGELVVVTKAHVNDASGFLHKLYSYDNFGYLRVSKRLARNAAIARKNKQKIQKWLVQHPRLMEFLLDRKGSFRSQDLEEMAHMQRDEVNNVLGVLSEAKMVSKDKSQIIIEPELADVLKEIEDDK